MTTNRTILILWSCAILVMAGCSIPTLFHTGETPARIDDALLAQLYRTDRDEIIKALAAVTVRQESGSVFSHQFALAARHPSFLKVESLPTFGMPTLYLSYREGEIRLFVPAREQFLIGTPDDGHRFSLFGLAITAPEALSLLTGIPPLQMDDADRLQAWRNERGEYRIDFLFRDQLLQRVRLDPEGRLNEAERYETGGRLRFHALFGGYEGTGADASWPRNITVHPGMRHSTTIELRLRDVSVVTDAPPSLFELPVPPGVDPRPLH